jgi:hypothetical protein
MWVLLWKVSAPGIFIVLNPWASAPVAYSPIRPKSQIFNIGHDYALWIRNFMVMMKTPRISILILGQWPTAMIRPKSQNSNIKRDGILSIGIEFYADDK